jgi:cytochrome P450
MGKTQMPPWCASERKKSFDRFTEVYYRKRRELEQKLMRAQLAKRHEQSVVDAMSDDEVSSRCLLLMIAGVETEDEMWSTPTDAVLSVHES